MGKIAAFFGFGNSSNSGSASTSTHTSGMSTTGWYVYDEETARRHHREAQVSLPEAKYNPDGTRKLSDKPDPTAVNDTFWRTS